MRLVRMLSKSGVSADGVVLRSSLLPRVRQRTFPIFCGRYRWTRPTPHPRKKSGWLTQPGSVPHTAPMTIRESNAVLSESVRRLREALSADAIYLFGSRARGDAAPDSDFDFLVVVNDSSLPRFKREQQAFRALCGIGVSKDVLVFTREEFDRALFVASSLPSAVVREGRMLYGRQ